MGSLVFLSVMFASQLYHIRSYAYYHVQVTTNEFCYNERCPKSTFLEGEKK